MKLDVEEICGIRRLSGRSSEYFSVIRIVAKTGLAQFLLSEFQCTSTITDVIQDAE